MSDLTTPPSDGTAHPPTGNESIPYPPPTGYPPVVGASPAYAMAPQFAPPASSRRKTVLIVLGALVVALVVAGLVRWGLTAAFAGSSKQETIDKSVSQIKEQAGLPKQIDQYTTWTDVKAEADAVHYEYTVSSAVDPSSITETAIRNSVLPTLCSTSETRRLLDDDIAMRYSYTFSGSSKVIDTTITKADC